jgi:hypothetical protein
MVCDGNDGNKEDGIEPNGDEMTFDANLIVPTF